MSAIRRIAISLIVCSALAACAKKSAQETENATAFCRENKLDRQFIVHWKDQSKTLLLTSDLTKWIQEHQDLFEKVEPNYRLSIREPRASRASESSLSVTEIREMIGVNEAWRQGYRGKNIRVAIVDSGVQENHPSLKKHITVNSQEIPENGIDDDGNGFIDDVSGWNFINEGAQVIDELGHGTAIAGVVTGDFPENESLGLAPEAQILPVDFMNGAFGNEYNAGRAIEYALKMKSQIINNSWSISCSDYLRHVFWSASRENVIFVNASGNNPVDVFAQGTIPSSLKFMNFLNVGSISLNGKQSSFSGYGESVQIWTLGERIPVITPTSKAGEYLLTSGTSISAGIVSGAAAVVWSAHPNESAPQIIDRLIKGSVQREGKNILNISRALH